MSTIDEQVVWDILDEDVVFYVNKNDPERTYAEYIDPATKVTRLVATIDPFFKAYLGCEYRSRTDSTDRPKFEDYIATKCEELLYERKNIVTICRRLSGSLQDRIIYNLGDEDGQIVVINEEGCSICTSDQLTDCKFEVMTTDEPQVEPVDGGDLLTLLRPFVNMDKDSFILFAVCLIQYFSRNSAHFAIVISSGKGTGKTLLTKLIRSLVDPRTVQMNLTPKSDDDLKVQLNASYMVCFDNTAPLKESQSNILCSAITGSQDTKRRLYSDTAEVVLDLHNAVVLNGIDIVPYKSDLADRCLLFKLDKISETMRKPESEFWSEFQKVKPQILGAIFEALEKAKNEILPTLNVKKFHRMADAYKEMIVIAMALGVSQDEFQRIFDSNRQKLQDAYIQSNPFVELVLDYMNHISKNVDEPAKKLFEKMKEYGGNNGFFPKSPSALSRKLNENEDALKAAGYGFSSYKKADFNHIRIERIAQSKQTKAQKEAIKRKNQLLDTSDDDSE